MDISLKSDPSKIELALHGLIKIPLAGVCDFVKTGSRNTSENPDCSVYCNASVPILDIGAIQQTTTRIEIYAKQIGGFKNNTKLTEIRDIIIPLIENVKIDNSYLINKKSELSRPDGSGFDFIFINLNVTII